MNRSWISNLEYQLGFTYGSQKNESSTYYSGTQQVTTYTAQAGEHAGVFLPPHYFSQLSVEGKPLSGDVSSVTIFNWGFMLRWKGIVEKESVSILFVLPWKYSECGQGLIGIYLYYISILLLQKITLFSVMGRCGPKCRREYVLLSCRLSVYNGILLLIRVSIFPRYLLIGRMMLF